MNEEAVKDGYDYFVKTGYKGTLEEYIQLMGTNSEAVKDTYTYFQETGYNGSEEDFNVLFGLNQEVKKKDQPPLESESPTPDGESVATETEVVVDTQDLEEVKDKYVIDGTPVSQGEGELKDIMKQEEESAVPFLNYYFEDKGVTFEQTGVGDATIATIRDKDGNVIAEEKFKLDVPTKDKFKSLSPFNPVRGLLSLAGYIGDAGKEAKRLEDWVEKNQDPIKKLEAQKTEQLMRFKDEEDIEATFKEISSVEDDMAKVQNDFVVKSNELESNAQKLEGERIALDALISQGLASQEQIDAYNASVQEHTDKFNSLQAEGDAIREGIDNHLERRAYINKSVGRYAQYKNELKSKGVLDGIATGDILGAAQTEIAVGASRIGAGNLDYIIDVIVEMVPRSAIEGPKDKDKPIDELQDEMKKELKAAILPAAREGAAMFLGGDVPKEYIESAKEEFFYGSILGVFESLSAMVGPSPISKGKAVKGIGQKILRYLTDAGNVVRAKSMAAQVTDHLNEEMMMNPEFKNISEGEKKLITAPIAIVSGVLENLGFRNIVNRSGLLQDITMSVLRKSGKKVTAETFEDLVQKEVKSRVARGVLTVASAGLAEAETGGMQEIADIYVKRMYNMAKDKEMFDTPEAWSKEYYSQVAKSAVQEAIGGMVMGSIGGVVAAANNDYYFDSVSDLDFDMFLKFSKDSQAKSAFVSEIKNKINDPNDPMTKEEGQRQIDQLNQIEGAVNRIPSDYSLENKRKALSLLMRQDAIKRKIANKDERLTKRERKEIDKIDGMLDKVDDANFYESEKQEQDAIQEPSTETVDVQESTEDSGEVGARDTEGEVTQEGEAEVETPTTEVEEEVQPVTEEVVTEFRDTGAVPEPVVRGLAVKTLNGEALTEQEQEIYDAQQEAVDNMASDIAQAEQAAGEGRVDSKGKPVPQVRPTPRIVQERIRRQARRAKRALSVLLPDLDIVLHDNFESFEQALPAAKGKRGAGGAFDGKNTIHINLEGANARTVAHEIFHAAIKRGIKSNEQLTKLTDKMLSSVLRGGGKALNKVVKKDTRGNDVTLKEYLEQFATKKNDKGKFVYKESLQSEEQLAEMAGFLAASYMDMGVNAKTSVKAWIAKAAKALSLGRVSVFSEAMSDKEAIDLLNTIAGATAEGKKLRDLKTVDEVVSPKVSRRQRRASGRKVGAAIRKLVNNKKFVDAITAELSKLSPKQLKSVIQEHLDKMPSISPELLEAAKKAGITVAELVEQSIRGAIDVSVKLSKKALDALNKIKKAIVITVIAASTLTATSQIIPQDRVNDIIQTLEIADAEGIYLTIKNFTTQVAEEQGVVDSAEMSEIITDTIEEKVEEKVEEKSDPLVKAGSEITIGDGKGTTRGVVIDLSRGNVRVEIIPADSTAKRGNVSPLEGVAGIAGTTRHNFESFSEASKKYKNKQFPVQIVLNAETGVLTTKKTGDVKATDLVIPLKHSAGSMENNIVAVSDLNLTATDGGFIVNDATNATEGTLIPAKITSEGVFPFHLGLGGGIKTTKPTARKNQGFDTKKSKEYRKSRGGMVIIMSSDGKTSLMVSGSSSAIFGKLSELQNKFPNKEFYLYRGDTGSFSKSYIPQGDTLSSRQIQEAATQGATTKGVMIAVKADTADGVRFQEGSELLAPNGKPSNLTPEQHKLVRTPAFKKWFGDWENDPKNASKVVDENGEPLVVYHGTTQSEKIPQKERIKLAAELYDKASKHLGRKVQFVPEQVSYGDGEIVSDFHIKELFNFSRQYPDVISKEEVNALSQETRPFDIFNVEKKKSSTGAFDAQLGFFFTPNKEFANRFTYTVESNVFMGRRLGPDKYTYPKGANVRPFFLNLRTPIDLTSRKIPMVESKLKQQELAIKGAKKIKQDGNDGVINKLKYQGKKELEYIAFEPNQIKLADGSNKTFDAAQESIRFQEGGDNLVDSVRFQSNYSDRETGMTFIYDKNIDAWKKIEDEGRITKDKNIKYLQDKMVMVHSPDSAFSGEVQRNGDVLIEGKGGLYFPIKFREKNLFWASTRNAAKKMAKQFNDIAKANQGRAYLVLTSAPYDKVLSSTLAANGVLDFFTSKALDRKIGIKKNDILRAIINAAEAKTIKDEKEIGLGLKIKKSSNFNEVISLIKTKLGADNSSFDDRKAFSLAIAKEMAKLINQSNDKTNKFFFEIFNNPNFKGKIGKASGRYNASAANISQALSYIMSEPALRPMLNAKDGSSLTGMAYAIVEAEGPFTPYVFKEGEGHESYPLAIKASGPVSIHLLEKPIKWTEFTVDPSTNEVVGDSDRAKRILPPSAGITMQPVKVDASNLELDEPDIELKFQDPSSNEYTIFNVVNDMRADGYTDSAIALFLSRQINPSTGKRYTKTEVKDAMAIPIDIERSLPPAFGNVEGGVAQGQKLFVEVMTKLKASVKRMKPKTNAKMRAKAHELLKDNPIFKEQTPVMQNKLLVELDGALGTTANKVIQSEISAIKNFLSGVKVGDRQLRKAQARLKSLIRKNLPQAQYKKSEIDALIKLVSEASTDNIQQVVDEIVAKVNEKKVEILEAQIEKILKTKSITKQGDRAKGQALDIDFADVLDGLKKDLEDAPTDPDKVQALIDGLATKRAELFNDSSLSNKTLAEIAAYDFAMAYLSTKNMENSEQGKVEALEQAKEILVGFVKGGRSLLKEQLKAAHESYVAQADAAFKDLTGIDLNDIDMDIAKANLKKGEEATEENLRNAYRDYMNAKYRVKAEQRESNQNKAAAAVSKMVDRVKRYFQRHEDVSGLMDIISKSVGDMFGGYMQESVTERIDDASYVFKQGKKDMREMLESNMERIFGKDWKKIVGVKNTKQFNTGVVVKGGEELVLSQNQIYYLYNMAKDPANEASFEENWGENWRESMDALEKLMTPQVREWADWQVDEFYPKMYERYNEVYRRVYRTNLPWNQFYAGKIHRDVAADPINMLDPKQYGAYQMSVAGGSTKMRKKSKAPIRKMDGNEVLTSYILEMERFRAFQEVLRDIDKMFKNKLVSNAIIEGYGKDLYDLIERQIGLVATGGFVKGQAALDWVGSTSRFFVFNKIAGNLVVTLKQLTSIPTYANDIGTRNWLASFAKLFASPSNAVKIAKEVYNNSIYLQDRYGQDFLGVIDVYSKNSDTLMPQGSKMSDAIEMITKIGMSFTKAGDAIAIFVGGVPNYTFYKSEFQKKNPTATEEQAIAYAIKKFQKDTKKTQQSGDIQDRDYYQTAGQLVKVMNLFLTTPKQYHRKSTSAYRQLFRKMMAMDSKAGKGTVWENTRTLIMYRMMMPMFFQWISIGAPPLGALSDEEEDDLLRAALLGNVNALWMAGDLLVALKDTIVGKPWAGDLEQLTLMQRASTLIRLYGRLQKTTKDLEKRKELEQAIYVELFDLFLPYKTMSRTWDNWSRMATGEEDFSWRRAVGYSDYVIDNMGEAKKEAEALEKFRKAQERMNKEKEKKKSKREDDTFFTPL